MAGTGAGCHLSVFSCLYRSLKNRFAYLVLSYYCALKVSSDGALGLSYIVHHTVQWDTNEETLLWCTANADATCPTRICH